MPTTEQLLLIWESQLEFFGGSGEPKQNYEGSSDENGLTFAKPVDYPITAKNAFRSLSGEKIGEYKYDIESDDFKIVIPNSASESNT